MQKRVSLKDDEIEHLKLEKGNARNCYRLKEEQLKALYIYRGYDEGMVEEAINNGVSPNKINHGWYKGEHFSLHFKEDKSQEQEEMFKVLIEDLKEFSPKFVPIKRTKSDKGHCLVIDPADIHIGKLATSFETGEDYNSQIAVQRVKEGVQGILDKSSGFNIDKIIFIGGNDILHIDTPKRTTTSGTPQDTDGMWYDNFLTAKRLYVDILKILITIADVHFIYNPSNHDYMSGFFLADVIQTHFRECKNISFDCSIAHRKYTTYGNSLIGTTHGDGAKQQDLGSLMSIEAKEHWATSEHRHFYTHHVHHKTSKDFINVTVESLRSPSGTDGWHDRNGYKGAPKAVEGFIHSKKDGQVARLTHIF